jgi:hypothetical protein
MGFSIVLFGTPLGYQYQKIDYPMDGGVCADSMSTNFDSLAVHKLGLQPSEKIWVCFKQKTAENSITIGIGLYQSAYEYNQNRSGGYYGVGVLLQDLTFNNTSETLELIRNLLKNSSQLILKNNKHIEDNYLSLMRKLSTTPAFNDKIINPLSLNLVTMPQTENDPAKLSPDSFYTYSSDITRIFDFLIRNECHFASFVCFGIDTPETKKSIETLRSKKLFTDSELISELKRLIKIGSTSTKEDRLRRTYSNTIAQKKQYEFSLDESRDNLNINQEKLNQLKAEQQSIENSIQTIEENIETLKNQLNGTNESIEEIKEEMINFTKETGIPLLTPRKPKTERPEHHIPPNDFSIFPVSDSNAPQNSYLRMSLENHATPNHQPASSTRPKPVQARSAQTRTTKTDRNINGVNHSNYTIIILIMAIICIIIIAALWYWKDSDARDDENYTKPHHSEQTISKQWNQLDDSQKKDNN